MLRTAYFTLGEPRDLGLCRTRVDGFLEAVALIEGQKSGDCSFDLATAPDPAWPLHRFVVVNERLATNKIAGMLASFAEEVVLVRGSNAITLSVGSESLLAVETEIYEQAAAMAGRAWLRARAAAAGQAEYARQQRLELLHCIALRCRQSPAHALFGRRLDEAITAMNLRALRRTGPAETVFGARSH